MLKLRLPLGRYFGIGLYVHWTFSLLLLWIGWQVVQLGGDYLEVLLTLGIVLSLFFCVTLHEYGHALTAKWFGVGTRDITLLPIGGVARLEGMPKAPYQELLVAIAGPAVNVVIATLLAIVIFISHRNLAAFDQEGFLQDLFWINLILVVFNMIPAFPMDGGRVLRSVLAMVLPYGKATRIAGTIGWVLALSLGSLAWWATRDVRLLLVAMFVIWAGTMEVRQVAFAERLKQTSVGQVMRTQFLALPVDVTVSQAVAATYDHAETAWPIVNNGHYVAMVSKEMLGQALDSGESGTLLGALPLAPVEPLYPEEPLEILKGYRGEWRDLPVVAWQDELVGMLDVGMLAIPGKSPLSSRWGKNGRDDSAE